VHITMRNCWIHNWGTTFDVRAFGAWAHRDAIIEAHNCVFTQDSFFRLPLKTMLEDLGNHIGQAWKDKSWKLRDWIMPGITRGLTCSSTGYVEAKNCYKNKWWIQIENHKGPYMSKIEAEELILSFKKLRSQWT